MGVLNGNQTQLGYLYPKTTDFIFSVIGEEMGFVVACSVIILNVIIITKSIQVAKGIKDDAGAYVAAGIAGMFLFHTLENIGMTMGLLPITGVPLLFVSYGRKFNDDEVLVFRNSTKYKQSKKKWNV